MTSLASIREDPRSPAHGPARWLADGQLAILLFAVLAMAYLLTFSGEFNSIDELAIPILFHAGRVAVHPGLRMKYADPVYLEGVALTARRCQVIVGHAGNPWKPVTASLAAGVYSIYIDLTTSGGADPEFIAQILRSPSIGPERLVWGSDGIWKAGQRLDAIQQNLSRAGASEEEVEMVLGGNAARLLAVDVLQR